MSTRYQFGRILQVMGMIVVLIGLMWSVSLGLQDEGLSSMKYELYALLGGGALFVVGRLIQGDAPS